MDYLSLLAQITWGSVAAAGFGILFNVSFRMIPLCAVCGAHALAVRTACVGFSCSLEAASFAAALTVGSLVQLLSKRRGVPQEVLDVVGCIPMIPGSFAAKAIVGLFAVTTGAARNGSDAFLNAAQDALRVFFTIGAIGTGLAAPGLLLRLFKTNWPHAAQSR